MLEDMTVFAESALLVGFGFRVRRIEQFLGNYLPENTDRVLGSSIEPVRHGSHGTDDLLGRAVGLRVPTGHDELCGGLPGDGAVRGKLGVHDIDVGVRRHRCSRNNNNNRRPGPPLSVVVVSIFYFRSSYFNTLSVYGY